MNEQPDYTGHNAIIIDAMELAWRLAVAQQRERLQDDATREQVIAGLRRNIKPEDWDEAILMLANAGHLGSDALTLVG